MCTRGSLMLLLTLFPLASCQPPSNQIPSASSSLGCAFSTTLGSTEIPESATFAQSVVVDDSGLIYVTGQTADPDLPAKAPQRCLHGENDAFLAVFDPTAESPLQYLTYFGGTGDGGEEVGVGIAVAEDGKVAITGLTSSSSDFPPVSGVPGYQPAYQGGDSDAFVALFEPIEQGTPNSGYTLAYFSYLGGEMNEGDDAKSTSLFDEDSNEGNNLALDSDGSIYVSGSTFSSDFPTKGGGVPPPGSVSAAYLAIFDPTLEGSESLVYATTLSAAQGRVVGHGIAVYPEADLTSVGLVGYTTADIWGGGCTGYSCDYPDGVKTQGFLTVFSQPAESTQWGVQYQTYVGATTESSLGGNDGYAVAADGEGNFAVTGRINANSFATAGSPVFSKPTYTLDQDSLYLAIFDPAETRSASLLYSTFLSGGGPGPDPTAQNSSAYAFASALAVQGSLSEGNFVAVVAGQAQSPAFSYQVSSPDRHQPFGVPVTENAVLQAPGGSGATNAVAVVVGCSPTDSPTCETTISYSTFWGGSGKDRAYGVALSQGQVVLSGQAMSQDFPSCSGGEVQGIVDANGGMAFLSVLPYEIQ